MITGLFTRHFQDLATLYQQSKCTCFSQWRISFLAYLCKFLCSNPDAFTACLACLCFVLFVSFFLFFFFFFGILDHSLITSIIWCANKITDEMLMRATTASTTHWRVALSREKRHSSTERGVFAYLKKLYGTATYLKNFFLEAYGFEIERSTFQGRRCVSI